WHPPRQPRRSSSSSFSSRSSLRPRTAPRRRPTRSRCRCCATARRTASLAYVLSELVSATPPAAAAGADFYDISPYPTAFAYGHAACRAALSAPDCAACLRSAVAQMGDACGHSVGARAVLVDCGVRYEQYAFV
ncbi:unnamed protein product, partial [Urochloa humidicola]